jgi:hypothetical protein
VAKSIIIAILLLKLVYFGQNKLMVMGEKRNAYRLLAEKPEVKRPLGRPRCKWVDNINMDLGGVGWGGVCWIDLTQDRASGYIL